jgi:hypothetical protein
MAGKNRNRTEVPAASTIAEEILSREEGQPDFVNDDSRCQLMLRAGFGASYALWPILLELIVADLKILHNVGVVKN